MGSIPKRDSGGRPVILNGAERVAAQAEEIAERSTSPVWTVATVQRGVQPGLRHEDLWGSLMTRGSQLPERSEGHRDTGEKTSRR